MMGMVLVAMKRAEHVVPSLRGLRGCALASGRRMNTSDTTALRDLVFGAEAILVVVGAGISTEAGIPDFRGPHGVWKTQRPFNFQDCLASESSRVRYWQQKLSAAKLIDAARPGKMHGACVELEHAKKLEAIVTQNIDGLHSVAGSSPDSSSPSTVTA